MINSLIKVARNFVLVTTTQVIRAYQLTISPLLGTNCRFHPSCSTYTIGCLEQWGLVKGLYLSVKRILRCHPWSEGGIDEIPNRLKPKSNCSGNQSHKSTLETESRC